MKDNYTITAEVLFIPGRLPFVLRYYGRYIDSFNSMEEAIAAKSMIKR